MLDVFNSAFRRFARDERGLSMVEYSVLAGLIVVGAVTAIGTIGGQVQANLQSLADLLTGGSSG